MWCNTYVLSIEARKTKREFPPVSTVDRGLSYLFGQTSRSSVVSRAQYWFVAVPHAILIWVYDEMRKLFIRLYPGSWWDKNMYY